jgi:protein-S-isoprenylcysteine O-methyltransferase Ste14
VTNNEVDMTNLDEAEPPAGTGAADWLELKIPPPVVAGGMAAAMWGAARLFQGAGAPGEWRVAAALAFAVAGIALAASGIVTFRRARTTINPHQPGEASALVRSGPYRFTRNPMYAGLLLVLAAWAIHLGWVPAWLGPAAFVLYIHRFQILPEERALQGLFGSEYLAYKSRVRRWL